MTMISGRRLPGELCKELLHRVRTDCSKCDGYSLPDAAHQGLRQARRGGRKKTRKVAFLIDNILSLLTFIQELSDLKAHQRRETMIKGIAPSPINNPIRKFKTKLQIVLSGYKIRNPIHSPDHVHSVYKCFFFSVCMEPEFSDGQAFSKHCIWAVEQ